VAILESEQRWGSLLEKPLEELRRAIDYSCQSTHFSRLFAFLLRAAKAHKADSASLFRPLDAWRLSPGEVSRLERVIPEADRRRFAEEAFPASALVAGVVRLSADASELRARLRDPRSMWFRSPGPGILSFLAEQKRKHFAVQVRRPAWPVPRFASISSNSRLAHEDDLLERWLGGFDAEIDVRAGEFINICFEPEVRAQVTGISVRFGGTAPVDCDPPRSIRWRLELFTGDGIRHFEFVHGVKLDESTADRDIDCEGDCNGFRITAITAFVSIVRIEVFGVLSLPEDALTLPEEESGH
jgi:hypothetical protein